jgi:CubicO group peptidase (beta-lactamase class C family)
MAYTPVKNNYGYGWGIDSIDGRRRVSHGGGIPGFVTNISRVPQDDIFIVLLSNASDPTLQDVTGNIYAVLYGKPYEIPKEKTVIQLPVEKLKEYEGEYEINKDLHVIINVKDGELVASPTGQPTSILLAEKEDFFFLRSPDIQIDFTRDDKKVVNGFVLHQNGNNIKCNKIK